jgi:predicted phage-related endonuclease
VIGHPDGLVLEAGRGWEGKTARTDRGWGEQGTDQVPQAYLIQVQHYMVLTALPVFDVDVLIGGQDERHYEVPADRELQEMIVEAEHDLWQRIQRGEPPNRIGSTAHGAALRKLYPGTDGSTIKASESDIAWRRVMLEAASTQRPMRSRPRPRRRI